MRIAVENASFSYGDRLIVNGCSFAYESPDTLCILGANGTGKSTLLRCIIGELPLSGGRILVDGKPNTSYSAREFARKIAYIPQSHAPSFGFTCRDVVTMGCTSRMGYFSNPGEEDVACAERQLEYLGVADLADKPYTDISGGERQLVMIASALAQDAEVMILDEPTAHLDFGKAYQFLGPVEKLRSRGVGVIMTTHFPDHALLLKGKTAILANGSIQAMGTAHEVVTSDRMATLYGIPVEVLEVGNRSICIPGGVDSREAAASCER